MLVPPALISFCEANGITLPPSPTDEEFLAVAPRIAAAVTRELDVRKSVLRSVTKHARDIGRVILNPGIIRDESVSVQPSAETLAGVFPAALR